MADIFISYTASDRDWAFWIAKELQALGHVPHIHEWEIKSGDDIYAWMEARHDAADHVLCVVSDAYLSAPYSTLERNAALWQAAVHRAGFVLFVAVRACRLPTLIDHFRRCELYSAVSDDERRARLRDFMTRREAPDKIVLAGRYAVSNIPIRLPTHFLGRDDSLAAIAATLARHDGRVAIAALYGLRGVGKTALAAAYAERHREDYRATWWIQAQTEPTMRADLVGLGVRLGWVAADEKEAPALAAVAERLRHEGDGILLIYDNAIDAPSLKPYLPRGGRAHALVTSNAHAWRGIADPIELRLWPKDIGADYLIARTGRAAERSAAEALSEALGGLPLAHEQSAAYCERLDVAISAYAKRFQTAPARFMDDTRHARAEYHDGLTVAKTFGLAIEEAARLHPAAEPLIVHAALLAPEPIPLFLFAEAREKLGEPLATALADDGLDEAVAALRAFALVDRETIADERAPAVTTDCIRLHRLVRQVAAARRDGVALDEMRRALIEAAATVYPASVGRDPQTWPRARRLDALALALLGEDAITAGSEASIADLLDRAGAYRQSALAAYAQARPLRERALAICEGVFGPEHPETAGSLNNLASLLQVQGDLAAARPLFERALAIYEKARGPEHRDTATSLNNLAVLLQSHGDLAAARPLFARGLAISEKVLGREHQETATGLHNLGTLLRAQGDLAAARPLLERALAIHQKVLGPEHPDTATSLNSLALLVQAQGDPAAAQPLFERAAAIRERVLGPEHPHTATSLSNLGSLLQAERDLLAAQPLFERALAIYQKALGREHPNTTTSLSNLGCVMRDLRQMDAAEPLLTGAIAGSENTLGAEHPLTHRHRVHYARLLLMTDRAADALQLGEAALATHARVNGSSHAWTRDSARVTADALDALDRGEEANVLRAKHGIEAAAR